MGISTAGGRDGRRNDPRSSAPLSVRSCGLTLPPRSSAGQLCPSSARSSRNHTKARPSGRNRRPACAHGREWKEAPKIESKPLLSHTKRTPLSLCHFSFPAAMPSSCLRSTRLILSWEQQSSVGSPKQVEVCTVYRDDPIMSITLLKHEANCENKDYHLGKLKSLTNAVPG
jgi:hypothetical protein